MKLESVMQSEVSLKEKIILYINAYIWNLRASLVALSVKNLPAMREIWVQSLGQEDSLEKSMATHCRLKNILTTWKLFYLVGMFRTLSSGDSISIALKNCSKEAEEEVRLYTSLQHREQPVWTSKIRYQVKEFSILHMGGCKPLDSLNSFLLYAPQLSGGQSLFVLLLAFPQLFSNHHGGQGVAACAGLQFGEPSCTFGGQKSLMAVAFFMDWYGKRYFHFTPLQASCLENPRDWLKTLAGYSP